MREVHVRLALELLPKRLLDRDRLFDTDAFPERSEERRPQPELLT